MSNQEGRIRILLADEQSLLREAVRAVLEAEPDLQVVAEVGDGAKAVIEAERTQPDVAVMDVSLPSGDGLWATMRIRERVPHCRVLIFSNEEDHSALVHALEAGASGYMTKECPLEEMIAGVRALHRGDAFIPPKMLGSVLLYFLRRRAQQDEAFEFISRLTVREKQVLRLLAEGGDNRTIAWMLVISPHTVRTHTQNVLRKLGVHSRLEAAAFVRHNGFLQELGAPGVT